MDEFIIKSTSKFNDPDEGVGEADNPDKGVGEADNPNKVVGEVDNPDVALLGLHVCI